ncbi:MAG: Rpp14/Pop5 family protein [Candidatus Bathyarchaeota archaeon]|nr:Rpp14/Pop5 family protein [Candidatus Bathyarchaeota archaeon]
MLKRVKRRYIALQLDIQCMPAEREFMDAVWGSVTRLYGEFGASFAGLVLIDYVPEHKLAMLRVNLCAADSTRVALATIRSIAEHDAAVHVLAISGTIKALRNKIRL